MIMQALAGYGPRLHSSDPALPVTSRGTIFRKAPGPGADSAHLPAATRYRACPMRTR